MFLWSAHFKRQFNKLPRRIQEKVATRLDIFVKDEFRAVLNNHKLHGEYSEYRSINITGDIRLLYKKTGNDTYLYTIGSHSELYE